MMSDPVFHRARAALLRANPMAREVCLGFPYWLAFLLVLEPGNVVRALNAGVTPAWDHEAVRILFASLLGASATPLLLFLVRRFPIEAGFVRRHGAIHALSGAAIAFGLIAASCLLAPWFGIGDTRPFQVALPDHLAGNWPLLVFSITAFVAIAHAVRFSRTTGSRPVPLPARQDTAFATTIPVVKGRGHVMVLDLTSVDWIETQGNYLALHAGAATHLIRETSLAFEAKVDPARFVRTHRRTIVAVDRVRELVPLANGDAVVRMTDGVELKVSRSFRQGVRDVLGRE